MGLGLAVAGSPLWGQSDSLLPGTRVRLRAVGQWRDGVVGQLVGQSSRGVTVVVAPRGDSVTIPAADLTSVERSRGRSGKAVTGALVGLVVGTVAAALVAVGFCTQPDADCDTKTYAAIYGAFGLGPAVVGAGLGALIRPEVWTPEPAARIRVTAGRAPGGGGRVGLSLTLP